jgi:NitT/TauT family transport system ATP-binding protein
LTIAAATTLDAPKSGRKPLVSLRSISKVFSNGTVALKDFSLDIGEGEFVSLLGPSGCGKSTALRIIAGLGDASSGAVEWPRASFDAAGRPEREIGFVFQEPTLMPWATVFANVWLPLRLQHVSRSGAPMAGRWSSSPTACSSRSICRAASWS